MTSRLLIHNAVVLTQADGLRADSMAVRGNRIEAVGRGLGHDPDFRSYPRLDLKGRTVIPGLVDAHTHFFWFALSLGRVSLHGLRSHEACLARIRDHASRLGRGQWVLGEGYAPDLFPGRREPDRWMLDQVTEGRPALLSSKDEHSAWVNSRALELAGIDERTRQPKGGEIVKDAAGVPTGILREVPGISLVAQFEPEPPVAVVNRLFAEALQFAYRFGVTGVHSFDGPRAFEYFASQAEKGKLGIRISYYAPASELAPLERAKARYGVGDEFLRLAGVKIFADGSLGSRTAYCFGKYVGTKDSYGIEVTPSGVILRLARRAARLGLPVAVHAIGDRAVDNVLTALERAPKLKSGARHRIEHLQMMRRSDIARLKRLDAVASMQPSHCPADIDMCRTHWGARSRNAYIFRTLIDRGIDLAFGSDCPIEPLDPIGGIAAAVRRARPGSNDAFYPEQRITAEEALYRFTVGPATASGQQSSRGYLLPGYPADFVVLSHDITRIPAKRIYDCEVLATVIDGKPRYAHVALRL